jgi:hypothetical protein
MEGSGIEVVNASPLIEGNGVTGNVSGYVMGSEYAERYFSGENVTQNLPHAPLIPGGILVVQNTSPVTGGKEISGNDGGGLGVFWKSTPLIENNTIAGNQGVIADGVLLALDSVATATNNTIDHNQAPAVRVEKSCVFNSVANQISGPVVFWPQAPPERKASSSRLLRIPEVYDTIQSAINEAFDGDTVIVSPGVYHENIDFLGKQITVKSENPNDEAVVEATVIQEKGSGPTISFCR